MKKTYIIVSVLLLLSLSFICAGAEYYRYTDDNGNVCFTDNLGDVPQDQRQVAKQYDSSETQPDAGPVNFDDTAGKTNPEQAQTPPGSKSAGSRQGKGKKLDREKEALDRTYRELVKQRNQLKNKSKMEMTKEEKKEYSERVTRYNEKISDYRKRLEKFNKKVNKYNQSVQQKKNMETPSN
jgi:septin family protein